MSTTLKPLRFSSASSAHLFVRRNWHKFRHANYGILYRPTMIKITEKKKIYGLEYLMTEREGIDINMNRPT